MAFANGHPGASTASGQPATRPDFTPPPRPAPQRNVMLEGALGNLKTAFDAFARSATGDLGGFRDKVNKDIAAGANDLIAGMNAANASFLAGRRDLQPCTIVP